jgi:hypothetical protein
VRTNASQYGTPKLLISDEAMKVVRVAISPCAKLRIAVARKIRTSARATSP